MADLPFWAVPCVIGGGLVAVLVGLGVVGRLVGASVVGAFAPVVAGRSGVGFALGFLL